MSIHQSSIRLRVFAGISLVSIIVLAIVGYLAYVEWNLRVEVARTRVQNSAQSMAASHNDLVQYTAGLIDSLAGVVDVERSSTSSECSPELQKELVTSPHIVGIAVLGPDRRTICSASPNPFAMASAAGAAYFRRALTSSRLVIGEALHGDAPGSVVLPFYKGVLRDTGTAGVIVLLVDLLWAGNELAKAPTAAGTRVGLVDAKGRLLALHPPSGNGTMRDISKTPLFEAIRAARADRAFIATGLDDTQRIYGTARFADTDAGSIMLFVSIPQEAVVSEVRRDFAIPMGVALAVIVLTFLAAAAGVDRLVLVPAKAVSNAARRFASGDMSARSGVTHRPDELGQLAQSFDAMADSLEAEKRQTAIANRALHQLNDALRRIPAAIAYIDTSQRCVYANRAYEAWFAVTPQRIRGVTMGEMLGQENYSRVRDYVQSALRGDPQRFELPFPGPDGIARQAEVSYIPDTGPAGVAGFFIFANDITDQKRQTEAFARLAHVDSLTGLPNRLTFLQLLDRSYKRAQRDGTSLAVLFLDLDNLKEINDTFGHGVGDAMLEAFARKLRSAVRAVDVVARLGGDEFTVLIDDLHAPGAVDAVVDKVKAALASPIVIAGHSLLISASIGVAERHARETTPEELLADADAAMYRAKSRHKGSA